jgi:hypothetical protein
MAGIVLLTGRGSAEYGLGVVGVDNINAGTQSGIILHAGFSYHSIHVTWFNPHQQQNHRSLVREKILHIKLTGVPVLNAK